jgi:CRISPR/Cas system CMR subunit Cmr6 (Cas7 group RAMP superfamily)
MDSKDEQKIRSELLSGGSLTEQQRRNEIEKRSSTKLAKDITEIMRRTNRQMAVELERSQLTLRSLSMYARVNA